MDDRARLFDDRHLRRIDRSARTANRTSRKDDPTRWSIASIGRRPTVAQLFAESIVLWPKRNTHIVGCDPTPRWCECHLAVDRRHRHADYRQSAGTNRHLPPKLSTQ